MDLHLFEHSVTGRWILRNDDLDRVATFWSRGEAYAWLAERSYRQTHQNPIGSTWKAA